jgi:hypothetical protein
MKRITHLSRVKEAIDRGGGIGGRVLIVGTRQEDWIAMHLRYAPEEVYETMSSLLMSAGGNVDNAAAHLNVNPDWLARFADRPAMRRRFIERATNVHRGRALGLLPAWKWPRTRGDVRPLVLFRNPNRSAGRRGAWRTEDLIDDARSKVPTLEVLRAEIIDCKSTREIADKWGVSRMLLWQWRQRWPEVNAIVDERMKEYREQLPIRLRSGMLLRLTVENAIEMVKPFLPIEYGDFVRQFEDAVEHGTLKFPIKTTACEFLRNYQNAADKHGRMVTTYRKNLTEQRKIRILTLIDGSGRELMKKKIDELLQELRSNNDA